MTTTTTDREADSHHDFESSRGDALPDGPCAVCGRHKEEWAHQ